MPNGALAVGATASTICAGGSTNITVASSETDVTYQLRNSAGNVHVGSPVVGSGATINLPTGNLTSTTTFNVFATRNVGGCTVQLASTKTIAVNPLPNAGLAVGAQETQIEVGASTNVTVAGSQTGVNYQLRKNSDNTNVGSPVAGTGGTILLPTGNLSPAGNVTFNVMTTNATTGCGRQLTQTVTIIIGHTGTIIGKVKNALAQPVVGATVTLSGEGEYTATTGVGGSYTINEVPQGTYTLTASANTYQSHAWENVTVTANATTTVWDYYLPHSWSKIGWHIQYNNITENLPTQWSLSRFFTYIHDWSKTCQMVKCVADIGGAHVASTNCPGSFSVGRIIDLPGLGDLQGYDDQWREGIDPAVYADTVYYGPNHNGQGLKAKWLLNPTVHVWEVTSEWNAHYDWQADFFIAMMDLAEPDGYRIAAFSSSYGTPSLSPTFIFPGDTRTVRENVARVCARAKAGGGHMLALHEYAPDGTLQQWYLDHGDDIVLRYRKLHNYLKTYNDPSKGYVGADCPIIITECSNNGGGPSRLFNSVSGPSDVRLFWCGGDVVTVPGHTYYLKLHVTSAFPFDKGIFCENEPIPDMSDSSPNGCVYYDGVADQSRDLGATICSDDDGIVTSLCIDQGSVYPAEVSAAGQTFTARGNSLLCFQFWGLDNSRDYVATLYNGISGIGIPGAKIGFKKIQSYTRYNDPEVIFTWQSGDCWVSRTLVPNWDMAGIIMEQESAGSAARATVGIPIEPTSLTPTTVRLWSHRTPRR